MSDIDKSAAESRESYRLEDVAKELNAPVEKLRTWIRGEGVEPLSPESEDEYGLDAYERIRARYGGL